MAEDAGSIAKALLYLLEARGETDHLQRDARGLTSPPRPAR
jgi:hypothetical protein